MTRTLPDIHPFGCAAHPPPLLLYPLRALKKSERGNPEQSRGNQESLFATICSRASLKVCEPGKAGLIAGAAQTLSRSMAIRESSSERSNEAEFRAVVVEHYARIAGILARCSAIAPLRKNHEPLNRDHDQAFRSGSGVEISPLLGSGWPFLRRHRPQRACLWKGGSCYHI